MPRSRRWTRSTCIFTGRLPRHHLSEQPARGVDRQPRPGYGNKLASIRPRISWRRCMDMNDRALRDTVVVALGGNGQVREDAFDITVASEVMAIFCLATSLADLEHRLGEHRRPSVDTARKIHSRRRAHESPRRHDRAAARRVPAQSRPDARRHARADPWRAVRQHRAWLQLGHRHRHGAQARRLCGDRGRLRRRSGRQVPFDIKCRQPAYNLPPPWSSPRCARSRCTVASTKSDLAHENVAEEGKGAANLLRQSRTCASSASPSPSRSITSPPTPTPRSPRSREACRSIDVNARSPRAPLGRRRQGRAEPRPRSRRHGRFAGKADFHTLYAGRPLRSKDKILTVAREVYRAKERSRSLPPDAARRNSAQFEADGLRPPARLHGQDAAASPPTPMLHRRAGELHPASRFRDVRLSAGAGFRRRHLRRDHVDAWPPAVDPAAHRIHVNEQRSDRRPVLRRSNRCFVHPSRSNFMSRPSSRQP